MALASPVPSSRCQHCGFTISPQAWQDAGHRPEPGDLTICEGCAHILRFDRHLRLVALTERDERAILARDANIRDQARTVARRLLNSMDTAVLLTLPTS